MSGIVLVTGASGNVGRAVAAHLVERGESVASAVRDAARTEVIAGTEAREFDFEDASTWPAAFDGIDRLFLLRPPAIVDVQRHLFPVTDAALERGVRHIVFLSLQGVQFNRATPHHAVEKYLKERSAPFTFLRPNFFMQNLSTTYRDDIRQRGEIFVPASRARTAFVDTDDLGKVSARVFTQDGHLGKAYTLSGEESLDYYGVARRLTQVLGYPVRYAAPSAAEYAARLVEQGAAADYIDVQKMIYKVVRMNVSAFPNRTIRKLTGEPATTFVQFAEREKAQWARS
ncbi:MAG: SDR family oxidoreductase [Salinibacterium sp.]|nr:SDR family oxidoreductase [Salinibacterium sp.]